MSAEDQEMMARISQLAGQINRHKNQQAGLANSQPHPASNHYSSYSNTTWHRGRPYPPRGYRAGMPTHRHRSLILNSSTPSNNPSDVDSDASNSSWVSKSDRHLQLINSAVYKKEAQARTKAIEQTGRQKQVQRDQREKAKLINHLNRIQDGGGGNKYEIAIDGLRFRVTKNGSKLTKVPGDVNSAMTTPKMAVVGGVKFYRSKNGNLYRHGIVKAQRQSGTIKKINMPCRMFTSTGSCTQGPRCRYIHDPSRVAACKDLLLKGACPNGHACDLSHDLIPERTPTCVHFAKGNCSNPNCRYTHSILSPGAPVCRAFGIYGYCDKGAACPDRHAFECPDFSNTGICKTKGCKLLHRERASVLRKVGARENNTNEDGEMDDLSSDEDEDEVDSNDVDSDEVEEFIGEDEAADPAIAEQKDFIELG